VRPFAAAIEELDRDLAARGAAGWRPARLVALSRRARRDRWIALLLGITTALGVAGFLGVRWFREREERLHEELLSKADLGLFDLQLRAFDWNAEAMKPIEVPASQLSLRWRLFEPSATDDLAAGPDEIHVDRTETTHDGVRTWRVEARGGKAILEVAGRGARGEDCAPSLIPLARLPGFADRERPVPIVVWIPTCAATRAGTLPIARGLYRSGGRGNPPIEMGPSIDAKDIPPETDIFLESFEMDRTEVTNAAYRMFAAPANATAIAAPSYPIATGMPSGMDADDYPVTGITWNQARAFCRFMGKKLPSDHEWERALRGPLMIGDKPNPNPIRTLPWGTADTSLATLRANGDPNAQFTQPQRTMAVDANQRDVSVEGILDLAGNVQEWTRTETQADFYLTRGCSWSICTRETLVSTLAVTNMRFASLKYFELGARCVAEGSHPNSD
jgi:formylglycine-generating enzyme required for sulfatase activity